MSYGFGFFFLGECQGLVKWKLSKKQVGFSPKAFLSSVWELPTEAVYLTYRAYFKLFFAFFFWIHWAVGHDNIAVKGHLEIDNGLGPC